MEKWVKDQHLPVNEKNPEHLGIIGNINYIKPY